MMMLCNYYDPDQFDQILYSLVHGIVIKSVIVSLDAKYNFTLTVGLLFFMSQLFVHSLEIQVLFELKLVHVGLAFRMEHF